MRTSRSLSRPSRLLPLLLVSSLVAAACGGGGDDEDAITSESTAPTTAAPSAVQPVDSDAGATGGTADGETTGGEPLAEDPAPARDCPPLADSLAEVNAATYAVYGEVIVSGEQGPQLVFIPVGTAWGVDRRLLVTNAHVTQAFVDFAAQGVQMNRTIAIQAGSGEVVELLRELTHPDYTGDPLMSPDVGLFTTRDEITNQLPLADDDVLVELGDEIQIVGFPGDVTNFIEIVPGETVPQATSLNGQVTALRAHDDTQEVTLENLDVIQHQAPTTPGTSGSSMVACGEVIGVNNAGTVNLIATPAPDGSLTVDRQAAAANNFAVHVRHIRDLLELFEDQALQGSELPPPAAVVQQSPPPVGGTTGGGEAAPSSVIVQGAVGEPFAHVFALEIDLTTGLVTGQSDWNGNLFNLSGQLFEDGSIGFVDDAFEQSGGEFRRGLYSGVVTSDTTLEGVYAEEGDEATQAPFQAEVLG
ncbi:MAG: trypsin-like peptidase domain-containing protein [Actinomycetota bacterium]